MLNVEQQKALEKAREKLSQIKLLRQRAVLDAGKVKGGDPATHYSWVNDHPDRIKSYEAIDYRISKSETIRKAQPEWARQDGTIRRGDLILMECPKDHYDAIKYSELLDSAESKDQAEAVFLAFADRHNVPAFVPKTAA